MNDIEKQIEGIEENTEDIIEVQKEEDNIKLNLNNNRNSNKKKKIMMYIIIAILSVTLITLLIYIIIDKKEEKNNSNNVVEDNVQNTEEKVDNTQNNNIGYVSCDDNTSLLNVRNSTSGNIIDGLSCYKEVTIEEELSGTEACDNWYKISYNKNGNNYTGYACGTYIKRLEVSQTVINNVRNLIDKANDYYDNSVLKAYCGTTSDTKIINFTDNMTGEYVKSEYKTIDELKKHLLSFLDEDLINIKLELSDINNPKYYDNYYDIDGELYCRNYAGKGWMTNYTNNYDIEVTSVTNDKINVKIAYEYLTEDSNCDLEDLSKCSKSDYIYEIGKITIENNIITKMDFHK